MPLNDGEVIRISFRSTLQDGQDHVNVYYAVANFASTGADADVYAAVNDWLDDSYSDLNAHISNTFSPVDLKIDVVEFIGGVLTITRNLGLWPFIQTAFNPTGAGDTLPPGVALLVKFLTTVGKTYGRKFIGGLIEASQNGGVPTGLLPAAAAAYATKILGGAIVAATGTLDPGVMSERSDSFVPFTSADMGGTLAYQRRRRLGTGS